MHVDICEKRWEFFFVKKNQGNFSVEGQSNVNDHRIV